MKKLFAFLAVIMLFGLVGCGKYNIIYTDDKYKEFLENYKKYYEAHTMLEVPGFKPLINMEFNFGMNFNGEHTFVKHNENLFAISDSGELKMCFRDLSTHQIKNDYAVYKKVGKYGVDDIFGNKMHDATFNDYFIQGNKLMLIKGRNANIFQRDKLVSSTTYTTNIALINENTVVKDNAFYDLSFNQFTHQNYSVVSAPAEGMLIILDINTLKFGYISEDKKIFIEPKFTYANDFVNGYARVGYGDDRCIINKNGEVKFSSKKYDVKNFHNEYFVFEAENMRGVMNKNFEIVIPAIFTDIMSDIVHGDYVISGNPRKIYSISNGVFIAKSFDSIIQVDKKYIVSNNNKYALLDYNLNTIISDCDGIGYFNKILTLNKDNKFTFYKEVLL